MTDRRLIRVRFALDERDFVSAMQLYLAGLVKPKRNYLLVASILALTALFVGRGAPFVVTFGTLALALFALGAQEWAFRIWPRMKFRAEPALGMDQEVSFAPEGVTTEDHADSGPIAWEQLDTKLRNGRVIVFAISGSQMLAVPRSAFAEPDEADRVWEMATSRDAAE